MIRYGISEQFEINSQFEYKGERITQNNDSSRNTQKGVSATDVGIRYNIYTGKGRQPSVGFQFGTRLPVLGTDYKIKDPAPRFLIITNQQLSDLISFNTVWGTSWNGNNSVPKYNYVINLSFSLNAKLGVFTYKKTMEVKKPEYLLLISMVGFPGCSQTISSLVLMEAWPVTMELPVIL